MKKIIGTIIVILLIGAIVFYFLLPNIHFGVGIDDGSGTGTGNGQEISKDITDADDSKEPDEEIIEIRIDGSDIYFDDEQCTDENDLKQRIIDIGAEKKYEFIYDDAIKGTYDEVRTVLLDLEDALGITVIDK